jgi:hypothetical protein
MTCFATLLYLRVEVEEGVEAHAELRFDLLAATLEDVHGDVRFIAILEGDGRVTDLRYLIGGQKSHSVDQC